MLASYKNGLALVTGAGDGIGEMLAKGFAEVGMRVAVLDIRSDAAKRVAREIGSQAFPVVADVSDRKSLDEAAQQLKDRGDPLNMLWLNAGVGVGSPVIHAKSKTLAWGYGVNVIGLIESATAFRPLLAKGDHAHVGVTASSAALRAPDGDFPLYAATKHACFAVAEAMRSELAGDGIGCTILCPGLLNTDIWDAARARPERFGGERRQDPSIAGRWRNAKSPDVMWPHIVETIDAGGGYLVCATDNEETKKALEQRTQDILKGYREV